MGLISDYGSDTDVSEGEETDPPSEFSDDDDSPSGFSPAIDGSKWHTPSRKTTHKGRDIRVSTNSHIYGRPPSQAPAVPSLTGESSNSEPNVASALSELTNTLKQVVSRLDKQESHILCRLDRQDSRLTTLENKSATSSSASSSASPGSEKPGKQKVPLAVRVGIIMYLHVPTYTCMHAV